ncbi:hypothetical protein JW859_05840, partial [bacterium]|nr:hypothetical protein [bacterium]
MSDERHLFSQGEPQAKDSSGDGADWYAGQQSAATLSTPAVRSRLFYQGTVAPDDLDRATDARSHSRIGIFGTSQSYAGSSGRVVSEALGRDLNPLGRGDGQAYVAGELNLGQISPSLPKSKAASGTGCSVNNP